ncbi:MAG: MoaD/ThiS family protein [Planctomycetaceae bacterium]
MPTIFIPAPLRELTGGQTQLVVPGATVGEVLEEIERLHPGVKARLCRGEDIIPGFQVSVNDVLTRHGLRAKLESTSEVHFLPIVGGG